MNLVESTLHNKGVLRKQKSDMASFDILLNDNHNLAYGNLIVLHLYA